MTGIFLGSRVQSTSVQPRSVDAEALIWSHPCGDRTFLGRLECGLAGGDGPAETWQRSETLMNKLVPDRIQSTQQRRTRRTTGPGTRLASPRTLHVTFERSGSRERLLNAPSRQVARACSRCNHQAHRTASAHTAKSISHVVARASACLVTKSWSCLCLRLQCLSDCFSLQPVEHIRDAPSPVPCQQICRKAKRDADQNSEEYGVGKTLRARVHDPRPSANVPWTLQVPLKERFRLHGCEITGIVSCVVSDRCLDEVCTLTAFHACNTKAGWADGFARIQPPKERLR